MAKLIEIGGYQINPDAIAYVRVKTIISGSGPAGRRKQVSELHFIGGGEPLVIDETPSGIAQTIRTNTR